MKAEARVKARAARRGAAIDARSAAAALAAAAKSLSSWGPVAGYWPIGDEIDCRPLLAALAGLGCPLALPAVVAPDQPLAFRAWAPGGTLVAGAHGTREPPADASLVRPGLVLVPLLAFDRDLYRLGYGGGYYDRTLDRLRRGPQGVRAIGLAYAAQEVAAVPRDGFDARLDGMLTERGLIGEKGEG